MSGRENGYGCRRAGELFPNPERRQSICLGTGSDRFGADNSRGSVPSHRNETTQGGLEGSTGELRNYSGRPQKTCLGGQEAGRGREETRARGEGAQATTGAEEIT